MKDIEIISKFYDNHSLSIVSRNLALELDKVFKKGSEYRLCITPLDRYNPKYNVNKDQVERLKLLASRDSSDVAVQIRHSYPPIWRWPVSDKTKVIFIQPWEFSKIPMEWQYKFETFADALITPSRWTGNRYLDAGIDPKKLFILPNGYNPEVFHPWNTSMAKFLFLYVGNAQYRKGLDILLKAWMKAFKKSDNVHLVIKDNPGVYGQNSILNDILKMQYHTDCGTISYDDSDLSEKIMAQIYQNSDVIVHPYRGEGFGMHIQEAMACGAYPLVSEGGATDDFVTGQWGSFIKTNRKYLDLTDPNVFAVKPGDSLTGMGGHGWIDEPDENDLAQKMRNLYDRHDREEHLAKVKNAKLFTWKDVAEDMSTIVKEIDKRNVVRR